MFTRGNRWMRALMALLLGVLSVLTAGAGPATAGTSQLATVLAPNASLAAIAVDASSANSATNASNISVAHTTSAGANRLMLVGVAYIKDQYPRQVTAVTYGTQTLTKVAARSEVTDELAVELWRLVAPDSGTATVTATLNDTVAGVVLSVVTFTGVDQTTPLGTPAANQGQDGTNAGNPTVTVASAAGELVFDVVARDNDYGLTVGSGQTEHTNRAAAGQIRGASSTEPGAASVTMSWSSASALSQKSGGTYEGWAIIAVPIKPLDAAGACLETVFDRFYTTAYTGNDGTQPWSTDWIEVNESDGPTKGEVRVVESSLCASGNCARIGDVCSSCAARTLTNEGLRRAADLSGASSATLSFSYARKTSSTTYGKDETLQVQVWNHTTNAWDTLTTYDLGVNDSAAKWASFALSAAQIGPNTQVRFLFNGVIPEDGKRAFYIDDVQIEWDRCGGPTLSIDKSLTTTGTIYPNQEIAFAIQVRNTGRTTINYLPLQDMYDSAVLQYLGATPNSDDSVDDGVLNWSNLVDSFGRHLAPGETFDVTLRFKTRAATTVLAAKMQSLLAADAAVAAPACLIEPWPAADCDGWQIQFDGESSTALDWRGKVDGTVIASGQTYGNETVSGTWPSWVDLSTMHTFTAGVYENGQWYTHSVSFGNCLPQGSIGDRVFYDLNHNGLQEAGEPGLNGIQVLLTDGACPPVAGAPRAAAITAGDGLYTFSHLPAGPYCVHVDAGTVPSGLSLTTNNEPLTVNLAAGQHYQDADFGYWAQCLGGTADLAMVSGARDTYGGIAPAVYDDACVEISRALGSIGDYVWYDADADGIQDVDEVGIGNVTLTLYADTDGSGTPSAGDTPLALTATSSNGLYGFGGLLPGIYYVQVSDLTGVLTGLIHTVGPQSKPSPTPMIVLGIGENYRDADFGYVASPPDALIGDTVWLDGDANSVRDGEPGLPNIVVCATPVGGGTQRCGTTNHNGTYFIEVPAGDYLVQPVNPPAGLTLTTPPVPLPVTVGPGEHYLAADFGYTGPTLGAIGNQVWDDTPVDPALADGVFNTAAEPGLANVVVDLIEDLDQDGQWDDGVEPIIATEITNANGLYRFEGLPAGHYLVRVPLPQAALNNYEPAPLGPDPGANNNNQAQPYAVVLSAGEIDLTADFGFVKSGVAGVSASTIGDTVWHDLNGNGVYEPDAGETGIAGVTVQLTGGALASPIQETTGPGGFYQFVNLNAGNYSVVVTDDFGVLADYVPTRPGPAPGANDNNQTQPYAIALAEGEDNPTADFGYIKPATLGDFTWIDTDGDSVYDAGVEPPLNGVFIQVTNSQNVVMGTLVTGPAGGFTAGVYLLGGLPPDTYTARLIQWPTGYTPAGPTSLSTTLQSGGQDLTLDFPFSGTTGVTASGFTAQMRNGVVTLRWQTTSEQGNAGFHVQRATAPAGPYQRLTAQPVPSQSVGGAGASYRWVDATARPGVAYWYQLVTTPDGVVIGPVAAQRIGTQVFLPVLLRHR